MVKKVIGRAFLGLILVVLYLPVVWLIIFSFTDSRTMKDWTGFSFAGYAEFFSNAKALSAILNTLQISLAAAAIATILGTLAAIGLFAMKRRRVRNIYNNISQIPMINADIVTAISLMLLFVMFKTFLKLEGNVALINVILAHVTFCTPYVILNIMPRFYNMDNNLYEAALDLGATPLKALRKVILPQLIPGVVMGFIMAITLSLDDFVVTYFNVGDSDIQTISTYIYGVVTGKGGGISPHLRALSSMLFLIIIALLAFVNVKNIKKKGVKK